MGNDRRPSPQHDPAYRHLCDLLKQWRLDAELTQVELGQVFGRPHTFIHKCEAGDRRIDPVELIQWCRACGLTPGQAINQIASKT